MDFKQIKESIEKKVFYPVYFLMGEEPYYIDVIADLLAEQVLTEDEKEFNQIIIYGRETDIATVISHAKRFPMMANYQVVIVREAQNIDDIEALKAYIENPLTSTILVICYKYKTIDKRKLFAKAIDKKGVLFESKKLYDNQIPDWINAYIRGLGYKMNQYAVQLLSDYIGSDLTRITNEIQKLIINIPQNKEITVDDIEMNIGISKDFNVFELQKALGKKQVLKAYKIAQYFVRNPKENPIQQILIILFGFFSKVLLFHTLKNKTDRNEVAAVLSVNPAFVEDYKTAARNYSISKLAEIFSCLREADTKSKGIELTGKNDDAIYKELLFKILH